MFKVVGITILSQTWSKTKNTSKLPEHFTTIFVRVFPFRCRNTVLLYTYYLLANIPDSTSDGYESNNKLRIAYLQNTMNCNRKITKKIKLKQ